MKLQAKIICLAPDAATTERDDVAAARSTLQHIKADMMAVARVQKSSADPQAMPDQVEVDLYLLAGEAVPEKMIAEGVEMIATFAPIAMMKGIYPAITLINTDGSESQLI